MNDIITCKHAQKLRIYYEQPHDHKICLYISLSNFIIINDLLESLNQSGMYNKTVEFIKY